MTGSSEENYGIKQINEAEVGDIIVSDLSVTFASLSKEIADEYSNRYIDEGNNGNPYEQAIMKIIIPAGSKVSRNFTHLSELVLPRGAKYEVLDKKIENGKNIITLKYIQE